MQNFIANDHLVMESIPKSEQASDINWNLPSVPLLREFLGFSSLLHWGGQLWRLYRLKRSTPYKKRLTFITVAFTYDPLGFLTPLVLKSKRVLHEVCQKGVSCDSPLPDELHPEWEQWKEDPLKLQNVGTPRCFTVKIRN